MRVGELGELGIDRGIDAWMRVTQKVHAVVRHQVEVAPSLLIPEVAAFATDKRDAAVGVKRDRLKAGGAGRD